MTQDQVYVMPASPAQVGLWLLAQLDPASTAYHVPAAVRLRGPLDAEVLARAFDALVARHEILRTTFTTENGEVCQVVHPRGLAGLEVVDLGDDPSSCLTACVEQAARPFDLEAGPLVLPRLYRLGDDDHVLSLLMHHIVTDGWSSGIMVRELAALYTAQRYGLGDPLPAVGLQYADFALWHRDLLASGTGEKQLDHWRRELAGDDVVLSLPTDRPRPANPTFVADRVDAVLDPAKLRAAAAKHGATLFMAVHAAFASVLAHSSGRREVRLGVPSAYREHAGTQDVVGFLANTLVVRTEWDRDRTFADLLTQVRDRTTTALANDDVPYGELARALGGPLVQAMIAMDNAPDTFTLSPGLTGSRFEIPQTTAKYELTLFVRETPDALELALEYSAELFDRSTAQTLLDRVLAVCAADTATTLGEIHAVTGAEQALLDEWSRGPDVRPGKLAHAMFAEHAAAHPDDVAVVDGTRVVTYGALAAEAERISGVLPRGGLVGVSLPRSADLVAALLAVWRNGCAYLPLDPSLPPARRAAIVADAQPALVLGPDEVANATGTGEPAPVQDSDLAYVLYTSGSTGRPKGVAVTHGNLANYLRFAATEYTVDGPPVAPLHTTVGFDLTVTSLWVPLTTGGTVHVVSEDDSLDGLAALLGTGAATLVKLTPAHLDALCDLLPDNALAQSRACFVVGGEALSAALVRRFLAIAPHVRVVNEYGPTEATVGCCVDGDVAGIGDRPTMPIGVPINGTTLRVLDERLERVPVGVPGELCISGAGVAQGYLGQPELTAESFVTDPCTGARMYRTGDLVRYLPDGRLEYLGRADEQVKIRGHRVEPAEVEAALRGLPEVHGAAVVAREQAAGKVLVGYVVTGADLRELTATLTTALPAHMVPLLVAVPEIPLTANGKVDRAALPEPASEHRPHVAPLAGTETVIADVWREVLDVEVIGRDDDFFALGGHSLAASRVVARLRDRCGVTLPMRTLFEATTPAELAAVVDRESADAAEPEADEPADRLSFAQRRLWFLDRLEPGSPLYNVPAAFVLRGELDVEALRAAATGLVRRHEALRTAFPTAADGTARVVVTDLDTLDLPVVDVAPAEVEQRALAQAATPFDLAEAPLVRLELLCTGQDHVLLVTMHHIISDGWSVGVLLRDLAELYRAQRAHETPNLPELTSTYGDHARRQHRRMDRGDLDGQFAYWADRLRGPLPVLDLPSDRPRGTGPRPGGELLHTWDAELSDRLDAFSREVGATPFITALAAFYAFLHRHTGQQDLVVGTPVAGRTHASTENLVGCFINMLPLRAEIDPAWSFAELVAVVRRHALDAFDHQDVPFERLVEQAGRDQSRTPLFGVLFGLQNTPLPSEGLPGLEIEELPVHSGTARFDLTVLLEPRADGHRLRMEYDAGLFDRATAARFAERYETVLRGALTAPDTTITDLPVLGESEQELLRGVPGTTVVPFPTDRAFAELFADQVRRTPDAIAVTDAGGSLTYAELLAAASRFAAGARDRGVRQGERVALLLERGTGFLTAVIGLFLIGAAYVPLDPRYPAARLTRILTGSRARLLLHDQATAGVLADLAQELPHADLAEIGGEPLPREQWACHPDDLAYVIFTSGSTGVPKGAMVEQKGMVNHLWAKVHDLGFTSVDTIVQNASVCFDISVWQFLTPLVVGGRVVVVTDDEARDPAPLWGAAREHAATVLETVPSMLRAALDLPRLPEAPELRWLVVTGEALPPALVRDWLDRQPGVPIVNAYGPTECSDDITHAVLTSAPETVPIGRPVPNMRLHVLDAALRPVPAGVPGELYAGGIGVGRGYLGDAALTAARFVPDPFSDVPGARLYRTGDLVRLRQDGLLEFLGRVDHQVKIRGHRVELGEIESVLTTHDGVRECVVTAVTDARGDTVLVAYVTGTGTPSELREHVAAAVGTQLAPAQVVVLESLPLNANGKIDRAALPAPEWGAAPERVRVEPRDDLERTVVRVWADVLGVADVGVTDDFFDLGGHSLVAVRVQARLREALGRDVPLRMIFGAPVAEDFAALLRAAPAVTADPLPATPAGGREPLSPAQARLWYFEQRVPGTHVLNMAAAYRISGPLDPARLERAINAVVATHDVLRTGYGDEDGMPYSQVFPPHPIEVAVHDVTEADLPRLAEQESTHVFDLTTGPVLRAALARLGAEDWVLFATVHHLAADGGSVQILISDVFRHYAGLPPLPPSARYADWTRWQKSTMDEDRHLAHWRTALADLPAAVTLPPDRPRTAAQTYQGALVATTVPTSLATGLRSLARDHDATLFMVLLAGFQAVLARLSGSTDVVVGSPVDGRAHPAVEHTVGCFINTLPLRAVVSPGGSFTELVGAVRGTVLDAFTHQDLPFERIVAELPGRDHALSPVFQVLFNMLDPDDPLAALPGDLAVRPYGEHLLSLGAKFDVSLYVRDRGEQGIALTAVYNTALYDEGRIADLLDRLTALLAEAVAAPSSPVGALPARTALDAALPDLSPQPAAEWNGGLLDRLDHWATHTPDAVAVDDGSRRVTHRELRAAVEGTAAALVAHGVKPGDVVAVQGKRHALLPAAVLGAMHAGATFLVLDPDHPEAERQRRCAAAGCQVVVVPEPEEASGGVLAVQTAGSTPRVTRDPDATAYLVHTSGTSGEPRAVATSERPLAHFLEWHTSRHGFGPDDRFAALSGPSHDPFLRDLFTPLWCGGQLRIPAAPVVRDPDALAAWLADNAVTAVHLTPSLARLFAGAAARPLPELRWAFFGGEPLTGQTCADLAARAPDVRCVNFYGATETPQAVAAQDVDLDAARSHPGATVPIGRGVGGAELLVRVGERRAGVGEIGEIVVRTPYLALGYLGDPELTAARFGDGEYRTGDLGRYRPDGTVVPEGRADRQLKVRGHRIEPGELESRLLRHPCVTAAHVLADGDVLVAHLTGEEQKLLDWCRAELPEHLVPGRVEWWDRFPLTANGKLDAAALAARQVHVAPVAPRTDAEHAVLAIWRDVLPGREFGVEDEFFAVGGHSLAAAQVLARIRRDFQVTFDFADFYDATTVAAVAVLVEERLMAELDDLTDDEVLAMLDEEEKTR
ncbi:amino acid adenylation domain-containing protein [Lentzea sp. NEAU-D13]|uniref:Amino acid adenylation domain-containing protein n=1 Tax=Lentzea alba TaxID=2714351 RepID=A0A7C9RSX6_9PSEU|nr:non-ribosomal peptide synthetase [Lentzea alba]NGY62591.1 amino acid adenylation domain-containing protein [Lentzea alba]